MLRFRGSLATLASALRFLFPVLAGAFLGLAALIGAASATVTPALFLLAGLAAFCLTNYLTLLLVTRRGEADRRRRLRAGYFVVSTALVVGVFAVTASPPMGDPGLPPAPVEGQRF